MDVVYCGDPYVVSLRPTMCYMVLPILSRKRYSFARDIASDGEGRELATNLLMQDSLGSAKMHHRTLTDLGHRFKKHVFFFSTLKYSLKTALPRMKTH